MAILILQNWYQLDYGIEGKPLETVKKMLLLISHLKEEGIVEKWFYLYEYTTIRIRLFTTKPEKELIKKINEFAIKYNFTPHPDHQLEQYAEDSKDFQDQYEMEAFANVMSIVSDLVAKKIEGGIKFSNFKMFERFTHCIFNIVYGSDTETYSKLKTLGFKYESNDHIDDPERTILDDDTLFIETFIAQFVGKPFKIPIKKK